ncbi:MAG: hypothetical protein EHM70_17795 [Chloroflexota bacterium]|nr:MAG: hypothetical protein EHM70_17795 [Chloroflexota bacterium]
MMRNLLVLMATLLVLAACSRAPSTSSVVPAVNTLPNPTATTVPATRLPTPASAPAPAALPETASGGHSHEDMPAEAVEAMSDHHLDAGPHLQLASVPPATLALQRRPGVCTVLAEHS